MARFALRLVELPTRNRRELENLVRAQRVLPPRALLDACSPKGEVDAIVMEADRADELERMQEKLQAAGVVTVLVDRDARGDGEGFLKGVLKRRTSTQTAPVEAVTETSRDEKSFQRLRQDGAMRQVHWWEWWLERGAMRLKLFMAMLFLVAGALTSIALTGLLAPVAEFEALTQTDEADENGNPVPSARTPAPGGGSGDEMPEEDERPGAPGQRPGSAGAAPAAAAAASEDEAGKPEPPIARWIGWAVAGVITGFLAVLTHRQRNSVSTRMARNLRLALWAVTGGTLVFLVLSVVRTRPSGPSSNPMEGSQQEPAAASASGASPTDEASSAPSMSLPEWARTLPPPGSFSSMNQQLGLFPSAEGSAGETPGLASALPPACDAPPGSFAELACLLGRVPTEAPPSAAAAEGSATATAAVNMTVVEGSASPLSLAAEEGSANVAEASGAVTPSGEGSAADEQPQEASSGGEARDSGEGTGSPAEASGTPAADAQPGGAGALAEQSEPVADNSGPPGESVPSMEGGEAGEQPAAPASEPPSDAAPAGPTETAAQGPDDSAPADEPHPAGTAGSIISFLVGWLLGATGAWLATRRRNIQ